MLFKDQRNKTILEAKQNVGNHTHFYKNTYFRITFYENDRYPSTIWLKKQNKPQKHVFFQATKYSKIWRHDGLEMTASNDWNDVSPLLLSLTHARTPHLCISRQHMSNS